MGPRAAVSGPARYPGARCLSPRRGVPVRPADLRRPLWLIAGATPGDEGDEGDEADEADEGDEHDQDTMRRGHDGNSPGEKWWGSPPSPPSRFGPARPIYSAHPLNREPGEPGMRSLAGSAPAKVYSGVTGRRGKPSCTNPSRGLTWRMVDACLSSLESGVNTEQPERSDSADSMAQSESRRQPFETDGHSLAASAVRDQAPALSSNGALARFEFEAGRGNEGTKILMVEWSGDSEGAKSAGDWEVSWEGKSTAFLERDHADGKAHRLYFLLPPGSSVPRIVKIHRSGGKTMQTNPLPAIFPAELGVTARAAGKKGVLHTIWAKQRLSALQTEINKEMSVNAEGVGLEMALREQEWIRDNFGIKTSHDKSDSAEASIPTSPKTPGGGRLAERLKGLKLGTAASDLNGRSSVPPISKPSLNPLSPDVGDVAVSSFSAFHGGTSWPVPRLVAQSPPGHILAPPAEAGNRSRIGSLNAVAGGVGSMAPTHHDDDDNEDDLFAVMVSPRSPDMTKSPFSFSNRDIMNSAGKL